MRSLFDDQETRVAGAGFIRVGLIFVRVSVIFVEVARQSVPSLITTAHQNNCASDSSLLSTTAAA
jgi:hypothetical protein